MDLKLYTHRGANKWLILVGGSGDTIEKFKPLAEELNTKLASYTVCSFSFTTFSKTESVLDIQAKELAEVLSKLVSEHTVNELDIFCTSMGAYATTKALVNPKFSKIIRKAIFFDPADYYISQKFDQVEDVTWSGNKKYLPTKKVISHELSQIKSNTLVDVVHLTLKNYSDSGYFSNDYLLRGKNHINGWPRLSTEMVKAFYKRLPTKNKGKYIEVTNLPHGFIRDGSVKTNIDNVTNIVTSLLK